MYLNVLIDDMIQDVYVASKDANKTMINNSEHFLATFQTTLMTESDEIIKQKSGSNAKQSPVSPATIKYA